eukprot:CAMPEP_0118875172 /NCGR_PEP_ID=MMETSP1163-20130328/16333_1 /TAXON_ID=124430 /ORGANISM="Phaeomonas parva, Strain CCMP2877" /LENGTH=1131 /DNA_ID=CAMNT_0006810633 /DNA_START=77 /DNA_END=3472 /DNA_ORIENTATION=+
MRAVLERRQERQRAEQRAQDLAHDITAAQQALEDSINRQIAAEEKRRVDAATKIQAVGRGYIGRLIAKDRRDFWDAAIQVQRRWRGIAGRTYTAELRWAMIAVAPVKAAVERMRLRSRVLREKKSTGRPRYHWEELYDPEINRIWYLERTTYHSCWDAPEPFIETLVCTWDPGFGYTEMEGKYYDAPCRKMFANYAEYNAHRLRAHAWWCPACLVKNTGLTFPACYMCGNTVGPDGGLPGKAEEALKNEVLRQFYRARAAIKRQKGPRADQPYEHLIPINEGGLEVLSPRTRTKRVEALGHYAHDVGDEAFDPTATKSFFDYVHDFGGQLSESSSDDDDDDDDDLEDTITLQYSNANTLGTSTLNSAEAGMAAARGEQYDEDGNLLPFVEETAFKPSAVLDLPVTESGRLPAGIIPDLLDELDSPSKSTTLRVCPKYLKGKCNSTVCHRAHPKVRDDADMKTVPGKGKRGQFVVKVCMHAAKAALFGIRSDYPSKVVACGQEEEQDEDDSAAVAVAVPSKQDDANSKAGTVDSANSPMGTATVTSALTQELTLRGIDIPTEGCPFGVECKCYHPYVRPTTEEIIQKIYPISNGFKTITLASGATLQGNAINDEISGWGVMRWPNGDVYFGQINKNKREGIGLFRSLDGREYRGEFKENSRHGRGVVTHPNGESYSGMFKDGLMEGYGTLVSKNGDLYEGEFEKGKIHGIGRFQKGNGDVYIGHVRKGKAEGLGILKLWFGESYRGFYRNNLRHGKGICVYQDKSKYVGMFHQGQRQGIGRLESANGDVYMGDWLVDMKFGAGRLHFANGDMYDGNWKQDLAYGDGIYRYKKSGDIYVGKWAQNQRNGRGTYVWANGSRYVGYWKDNHIHGKGIFNFHWGAKYAGEFQLSMKHGRGFYTWANGSIYKGNFELDRMCGFGEMHYKGTTGHKYAGEWKDNRKHGKGRFDYTDGNIYDGHYRKDMKHGHGKFTWNPGTLLEESYEGNWRRDKRHGHGTYHYKVSRGMIYEGDWVDGLRHGHGTLRFKDGSFYRGNFIDEQYTGIGQFCWADGSQYNGEFMNNQRHGNGTYLDKEGTIYRGAYVNDVREGPGELIYPNGNSYEGEFADDKIKGHGRFTLRPSDDDRDNLTMKVLGF